MESNIETASPLLTFLPAIIFGLVSGLILIKPIWNIFRKAGKNKALSLFIFLPIPFGLWVVSLILAIGTWPSKVTADTSDHIERENGYD